MPLMSVTQRPPRAVRPGTQGVTPGAVQSGSRGPPHGRQREPLHVRVGASQASKAQQSCAAAPHEVSASRRLRWGSVKSAKVEERTPVGLGGGAAGGKMRLLTEVGESGERKARRRSGARGGCGLHMWCVMHAVPCMRLLCGAG